MKNYWPLLVISLILLTILGMSQYADHSKRNYEESHTQVHSTSVAEDKDGKSSDHANESYQPPVWGKYVTFPEGLGAWAVVLTLFAIVWQSIETRKAAEAANKQIELQMESLRPSLNISNFTTDVFREAIAGEWVIVNMKIQNSGSITAYGMIAKTWIEFIEGVPPYKFTANARYAEAPPLNVHTGNPQGFFIPLCRRLTITEIDQMANAEGTVCFRVDMTYRAFGKDVHTNAAYSVTLGGMESISEYTSAN